jgi:CRISPR-associated endonuclease/helicase Cas3
MMVTFISQCEKKALNRTRRVLDAFADRIGDNTWQTVITQEGLLAVKKLLRKTASKNTAVSCHWLRSRSRSELAWIVGNKNKFDAQGRVPVNSTVVNRPIRDDRYDWKYLPLIRALASLAALLHDWGKASARFQQKLGKDYKGSQADRLRHEWVSCLLLKAFIQATNSLDTDQAWLSVLEKGDIQEQALLSTQLADLNPLGDLPITAKLVAWLVVTHHKLPIHKDKQGIFCSDLDCVLTTIEQTWGYENPKENNLADCLRFPQGLLADSKPWLRELKRWARKLNALQPQIEQAMSDGSYRAILHHARLCLMLGDHYFSSLPPEKTQGWKSDPSLLANTVRKTKHPKQKLDQHLCGVYEAAKRNVDKLSLIEKRLEPSFNTAELKRKSPPAYSWQDKAAKKVRTWQQQNTDMPKGFFAVNMASTGCGKTFANAKVMMALSEEGDSLRFILALGLRTLTLQTGDEYKARIFKHTDGSDLAVLIGSKAIAALHEQDKEDENPALQSGSESAETLLANTDEVIYHGEIPEEGLDTILSTTKDKKLLYAPVLVCTIDHIIAATETVRGGRYILPALRLLSSDLVIDEIDDFTGADLIAIGRLIHLAGMLGRKVMISSATIPPALAEGYFNAYQEGWRLFSQTRNASPVIGCAWIDEFNTQVEDIKPDAQALGDYRNQHNSYITKRVEKLRQQPAKRKAKIIDCEQAMQPQDETTKRETYFSLIAQAIPEFHKNHVSTDPDSQLQVSFGVVRMANIPPCIQLAEYCLEHNWPDDLQVRVMAYHSRQVLLLRHEQEKHLDAVLKRKEKAGETPAAFKNPEIRRHLDVIKQCHANVQHVVFLLIATPVEEVGRDHDLDWAIIEPSSYRSIIQLAGRVRRHRQGKVEHPNIGILQYNWRTIKQGDKPREPRFYHPGYETKGKLSNDKYGSMKSHDLCKIVNQNLIGLSLDAIPRIQAEHDDGNRTPMALLEHAVIASQLTHYQADSPETLQGYLSHYWYLTGLPQQLNRFRQSHKSIQLYHVFGERQNAYFTERDESGKFSYQDHSPDTLVDHSENRRITEIDLNSQQIERLWLQRDYMALLSEQAKQQECTLNIAATERGFGEITLDVYENDNREFAYNDQLGLYQKEKNHA